MGVGIASAGVAAVVALAVVALTLVVRLRTERRSAHTRQAQMQDRIEELTGTVGRQQDRIRQLEEQARSAPQWPRAPEGGLVITDAGLDRSRVDGEPVSNQLVLSAAFGEPLVKAVALGHGVRRALSPENRNRIRFEMRREVKRARKARKREMRAAWRAMRAGELPQPAPAARPDPGAGAGGDP